MKKLIILLLIVIFASQMIFAGTITSGALSDLGSATQPIEKIIGILKAVAIIAMVGSIIITGIKYLTADGGRKQEILKNGIVAVVISAVLILAAFNLPKVLGLESVVGESAVIIEKVIQ